MTTDTPGTQPTIEDHPWSWYGPADSHTLIVGTFPPTLRNWSFDFFYPNKANFFWRVLSAIAGKPLQHFSGTEAVEERKAILDDLKVTVTDMGRKIARMHNSSLDENLVPLEYMDLREILVEKPCIRKVIFTSSSGKANAAKWFSHYLEQRQVKHKFPKGSKPVNSSVFFANRVLTLVILYSPSARAANRISFEKLVQLYRAEIKNPSL